MPFAVLAANALGGSDEKSKESSLSSTRPNKLDSRIRANTDLNHVKE